MTSVIDELGGPLPDRIVSMYLLEYQRKFETGNPEAVIQAVMFCAREHVVMPEWLSDAFCKRANLWFGFHVKELGAAFDMEWPKGKSFASAQRKRRNGLHPVIVYRRVRELHERNNGLPIDNELFETVAREFHTNKTDIGKLYAEGKRRYMPKKSEGSTTP